MTGNAARSPALGGTVEAVTLPLASSRKITTPAVLAEYANRLDHGQGRDPECDGV
jgi:hypothetical protein